MPASNSALLSVKFSPLLLLLFGSLLTDISWKDGAVKTGKLLLSSLLPFKIENLNQPH